MNMDSLLGFGNQLFIIYSDLNSRLSRDGVLERIGKTSGEGAYYYILP